MGPLCHRKYREAVRPEIRAYFSHCPAITAAPRLHGRAATNMDVSDAAAAAAAAGGGRGGARGGERRTGPSGERPGDPGEIENPISYSSGIPLDLPAFLLHLPPVRICFIYISYFSLSLSPCRDPRSETRRPLPRGFTRGDQEVPTKSRDTTSSPPAPLAPMLPLSRYFRMDG